MQVRALVAQEIVEVRNHNHNSKLALWELKNQILELKGILNDEEEETKRLDNELNSAEQYEQEEEGQNEMPS